MTTPEDLAEALEEIQGNYPYLRTPEDVIREALREFIGDGDGIDERILAAFVRTREAEALRAAAADDETGWALRTWLNARADRIEMGGPQ